MPGLFRTINVIIIEFVVVLWLVDEFHFQMAVHGDPPHRLVSTQVILALIAASTAQLGLLAVAIGRAIFKQLDLAPHDAVP
jgi:hypothetical protein